MLAYTVDRSSRRIDPMPADGSLTNELMYDRLGMSILRAHQDPRPQCPIPPAHGPTSGSSGFVRTRPVPSGSWRVSADQRTPSSCFCPRGPRRARPAAVFARPGGDPDPSRQAPVRNGDLQKSTTHCKSHPRCHVRTIRPDRGTGLTDTSRISRMPNHPTTRTGPFSFSTRSRTSPSPIPSRTCTCSTTHSLQL
jgi:hypothetical protein